MTPEDISWLAHTLLYALGAGGVLATLGFAYARSQTCRAPLAQVLLRREFLHPLALSFLLIWVAVLWWPAEVFQKFVWGGVACLAGYMALSSRPGGPGRGG